ncbi:hypothetical protein D9757_004361 [Collybiopsis confluens]|uniref:Uncharacterized protein n=1 Tax=Collybiopsis confluens TaxID=2823264 RepID=A0A8H5HTM5_9AGAR|nr:hypothetical protein D9757_004361 [Collybiopsis confluens]
MASVVKPPFRSSITVPELIQFHYENNPSRPAFVFADGEDTITEISYLEYVRACHRVAHIIRPQRAGPDRAVIALVALSDNLVYQSINVGIMQAGLVPFLISPRLTPPAVINLLKVSGAHRLLTTESTLGDLVLGIKEQLATEDPAFELSIEEAPTLNQLYPKLGHEKGTHPFEPYYPWKPNYPSPKEIAVYLHSSGSTGFPKAIPLSHFMLDNSFANVLRPYYNYHCELRMAGMSAPPFHLLGIYTQFITPLYGAISVALYPPTVTQPGNTPLMATPATTVTHSERTRCNAIVAVPAMLQVWSQNSSGIDFLRAFETVTFAGGPLAPATGDYLVSCGVRLRTVYGATEFGLPTKLDLEGKAGFEDWAWINLGDEPYIRWAPQGDGTSELQLLTTESFEPAVKNLEDVPGYATSDLFSPHPTNPSLWNITGRTDDVIIHSSGEKTVPLPMEHVIISSPLIQGAVMFGRQRDQPGILIELIPDLQIDVSDEAQVAEFRNKIWPVIEQANQIAPAFSRVYKEMILFTTRGKPLPRAAKGTVMRKASYKEYEKEIDELYEVVEANGGGGAVTPPPSWNSQDVQDWIMTQVFELGGSKLGVADDLFEHGIDSLSATIIRLRLATALRNSDDATAKAAAQSIDQAAIYSHPTVESLAKYVVGLIDNSEDLDANHEVLIEQMIEKYSTGLGSITASDSEVPLAKSQVVLLTGSTGNLGSDMLASLLANQNVAKVYVFNRPSSQSSNLDRHRKRFEDKLLDAKLLSSQKLVFLEGEASQPHLGLSDDLYRELLDNVTLIIHNAWRLDFNLSLPSFEPHIRGTRNLIDMARASRFALSTRFLFTSSISAGQSWNTKSQGPYLEQIESNPKYAVGGGYGESKYVSERILQKSGLHTCVLRIGQISGGNPSGAWATSDWYPMMVKSSVSLGILPDAHGVVSWTPMDAISEAILDVAFVTEPLPAVVNLVHPSPRSWTSVVTGVRKALISAKTLDADSLQLVSLQKWTAALDERSIHATTEETANDIVGGLSSQSFAMFRNFVQPAAKILGIVKMLSLGDQAVEEDGNTNAEAGGFNSFVTDNAVQISPRMKSLEPLGEADTDRWVKYWIRNGF